MAKAVVNADLAAERAKASFDSEKLHTLISGGAERAAQMKKWRALFDAHPVFDTSRDCFLPRRELFRLGVARAMKSFEILRANPDLLAAHSPAHGGGTVGIGDLSGNFNGISDHFALFVGTLFAQATPEQQRAFMAPSLKLNIIGTYAQTELGHGSNLRALETTATFIPETDEIEINSPTPTSYKWWPGALGLLATHALVYARLILPPPAGSPPGTAPEDKGFHAFVVQLRDEHHRLLPGVVTGDIGPKMGFTLSDSGYCAFSKVRVPRFNMLSRFQQLGRDGAYTKPPRGLVKVSYLTMTITRASIVWSAARVLAKCSTIAARWLCVRRQGAAAGGGGDADDAAATPSATRDGLGGGGGAAERQAVDWPVNRATVLHAVALSYALKFAAVGVAVPAFRLRESIRKQPPGADDAEALGAALAQLHAASAGLKAFGTQWAAQLCEALRVACGGQGYTMAAGIAPILLDFLPSITYEGERTVMALQTARWLIKAASRGDDPYPPDLLPPAGGACPVPASPDALADEKALKTLFKHRAAYALAQARAAGLSSHVAAVRAAEAHCRCLTLQAAFEGARRGAKADAKSGAALRRLATLHGLATLCSSQATDWPGGYLAGHSAALERALAAAEDAVRPDLVGLVDAHGFSDRDLRHSTIGRWDGDAYTAIHAHAAASPLNAPEYVEGVWRDFLKPTLDASLLAAGAKSQRCVGKAKL